MHVYFQVLIKSKKVIFCFLWVYFYMLRCFSSVENMSFSWSVLIETQSMKTRENKSTVIAITIYISISIEFKNFEATNLTQEQFKRKRAFNTFKKILQSRLSKNRNQNNTFMKNSSVDAVFRSFAIAVKSRRVFAKKESERLVYIEKELSVTECLKCSRWDFYYERIKDTRCDRCQDRDHWCSTLFFILRHALIILIKLRKTESTLFEVFFVRKRTRVHRVLNVWKEYQKIVNSRDEHRLEWHKKLLNVFINFWNEVRSIVNKLLDFLFSCERQRWLKTISKTSHHFFAVVEISSWEHRWRNDLINWKDLSSCQVDCQETINISNCIFFDVFLSFKSKSTF